MVIDTVYSNIKTLRQDQTAESTYSITFADLKLKNKPDITQVNVFNEIHKSFKEPDSRILTLGEVIHRIEQGQPFKNGIYAIDNTLTDAQITELRDLKDIDGYEFMQRKQAMLQAKEAVFKETNLAILDIDDVRGATDPIEVMETLGAIASYFSYSDGQTHLKNQPMRRYRLIFELSDKVTDIKELEFIQGQLKAELVERYPVLKDERIQGKDNGIDNIVNGFFYGTNKQSLINKNKPIINVKGYMKDFKELKEVQALERELKALESTLVRDVSEQGLNDMVDFLGGLQIETSQWFSLAIGIWNTAQVKGWNDENVARQIQILDNDEHPLKHYYSFKRPVDEVDNPATIGSLIYLAIEQKYQFKPSENKGDTLTDEGEKLIKNVEKIDRYIHENQFLNILCNPHKTNLIVSSTNTGKTRASIVASRAYLEAHKDTFIYIAVPTTAIAEQNAINHKVNRAIFGNINVKDEINKAIYKDQRLLIGTYDKAPIVHKLLNNHKMLIIMDEAHKEVTDYSYRHKAISELFELVEQGKVSKFIGMTGTPNELDFKAYENIIKYELEEPKVLAEKLRFIEFNKIAEFDPNVLSQIQENIDKGNKALVLIDNKTKARLYQKTLKDKGIKASVISADSKQSSSYRYLLQNEKFKEDIQVILATRAIADGININNESNNYVCIIAPIYHSGNGTTETADFYNLDLIRQTANRLRFKYKEIIIPLFIPKRLPDARKGAYAYDLERQYDYLLLNAKKAQLVVKHNYKGSPDGLKHSLVEQIHGMLYKALDRHGKGFDFERAQGELVKSNNGLRHDVLLVKRYEEIKEDLFKIDKRWIRAKASQNKEDYYKYNPYAFKEALKQTLSVDECIDSNDKLSELQQEIGATLDEIREIQAKADKAKRHDLTTVLAENVYSKIEEKYFLNNQVNEDDPLLKELKDLMNSIQYRALLNVVKYLEYDQAIQELKYVTSNNQVNQLGRYFEAIDELQTFEHNDNLTARIYKEIKDTFESEDTYVTATERDEVLDELGRNFKITNRASYMKIGDRQRQFKEVFKRFFTKGSEKRLNRARLASYQTINFEAIAKERELPIQDIKAMYRNFIY